MKMKGEYIRLDNLSKPKPERGYFYEYKGYSYPANGWRCPIETMEEMRCGRVNTLSIKKGRQACF